VRRTGWVVLLWIALTLPACGLFGPTIEQIPSGGENITVNVTACEFDPTTGLATASFELISEEEYSSVLLNGELSEESGIVVGTGTGAVNGVEPDTTYRDDIVFSLSGEPEGDVSCNVTVELANP
jgi:hypothetical protein